MTASTLTDTNAVSCPVCGGQMYDNRVGKTNPKAPDFKCKNRACKGVIWPPKGKPADITPITKAPTGESFVLPVEKPKLTKLYLDATEFVIDKIVPMFEKAEIPLSDTAVIAAVATIFIAASKER